VNKYIIIFFLLLSFVWLASCSNKSVTVVNRGKSFYGKNNNQDKDESESEDNISTTFNDKKNQKT
jgi:hypothetical protein